MNDEERIQNLNTRFRDETLNDKSVLAATEGQTFGIMPEVRVMKIGGQSIIDRGRPAVFPILDEIVKNKEDHKMLLCVGGGTRARHTYEIAIDLGMPTGVISSLGISIARQNARMLQMLLAKHGGVFVIKENFEKLPAFIRIGCLPIMVGMPPFGYWEKVPEKGSIPANRTDAGTFLTAEVLGANTVLYVKDEDGLYDCDPKKNPNANLITRIHVDELKKMDLQDLAVERIVLDYLSRAKHVKYIQIINGLVPGNITKALNGEPVGSIIYRD